MEPPVHSGQQSHSGAEGGGAGGTVTARRFAISSSVVAAELGEESVLLDTETGQYFGLDQTGSAVWRLLAVGASDQEIVERLLAEYDVEPDALRQDVEAFLSALQSNRVLRRSPDER